MRTNKKRAILFGLLTLGVLAFHNNQSALPAAGQDQAGKPTKVTVQLRGAIGEKSVEALRTALKKVKGIKFDPKDIQKGSEPRFYTNSFTIEIINIKKTNIGAIAKAAAEADTPLKEELEPGLHLWLYPVDQLTEKLIVNARDSLANTKGVAVQNRGVGGSGADQSMWIRIDGSGQANLQSIMDTLADAGIKVRLQSVP